MDSHNGSTWHLSEKKYMPGKLAGKKIERGHMGKILRRVCRKKHGYSLIGEIRILTVSSESLNLP